MSHRLSEWCSNAPDLEDDIALANIALDLLGQARLLLSRAAAADPSLVPALPEGSPVPAEDALAFFREAHELHNVRLVEVPNGDFGHTVARLLLFATARLAAFERLSSHADPVLAAIAAKGVKELAYHRDYAGRWFVTLARGTEESRRRVLAGLTDVWPLHAELLAAYDVGAAVDVVLDQVFAVAGVDRPEVGPMSGSGHTEALSLMLAEMQVVARAHPRGQW
jgi:ring-1,2-phenylacetyl-CoA epoxidase subunit PaaC